MLSVFFYFDDTVENLKLTLESLAKQSSKTFSLYIFDNSLTSKHKETIDKFDFSQFKNYQYTYSNNVKDSLGIFYNEFINSTKSKYVCFISGHNLLPINFVESIIKSNITEDFALLNTDKNKTISNDKIKTLFPYFLPILNDKVFNINFLKNKAITFSSSKHNEIVFLFKVLRSFSKCKCLDLNLEIKNRLYIPYGTLHRNLEIVNELSNNYVRSNFWNDNNKQISFFISFYVIFEAIPSIFRTHKNLITREMALIYFKEYLNKYFKNWKENSLFSEYDQTITKVIKKFNFSYGDVEEIIKNIK